MGYIGVKRAHKWDNIENAPFWSIVWFLGSNGLKWDIGNLHIRYMQFYYIARLFWDKRDFFKTIKTEFLAKRIFAKWDLCGFICSRYCNNYLKMVGIKSDHLNLISHIKFNFSYYRLMTYI
jgi:hypothetical protein